MLPQGLVAHQAPLSMGFPRQEYWGGLPLPLPGDFPDPGIKPRSPALQADSLPAETSGKPKRQRSYLQLVFVFTIRATLLVAGAPFNQGALHKAPSRADFILDLSQAFPGL